LVVLLVSVSEISSQKDTGREML